MEKQRLVLLFLVMGLSIMTSLCEADRCSEPKKIGPCKAIIPRYYYNPYSRNCQPFNWGGCQPNGNNFKILEECQEICVNPCAVPKVGSCKARKTGYYYNNYLKQCQLFYMEGCQPNNNNNYETLVQCQQTCENPCHVPKKIGPCRARKPRYYFNKYMKQCQLFYWGGCKPNANNFETLKDCQQTCENPCNAPKKVGPCEAAMPRYYYNKYTHRCQFFYWGGCQPNANNFEELVDCQQRCENPCDQPKKIGPCRASKPRFYFNKYSNRCELFFWGGCKPNGNNFVTKWACIKTCLR